MSASAPAPAATGALEALFRQSHGSVTLHPTGVQAKLVTLFAGQGVTASEIRLTWPSASASVEEVEEFKDAITAAPCEGCRLLRSVAC